MFPFGVEKNGRVRRQLFSRRAQAGTLTPHGRASRGRGQRGSKWRSKKPSIHRRTCNVTTRPRSAQGYPSPRPGARPRAGRSPEGRVRTRSDPRVSFGRRLGSVGPRRRRTSCGRTCSRRRCRGRSVCSRLPRTPPNSGLKYVRISNSFSSRGADSSWCSRWTLPEQFAAALEQGPLSARDRVGRSGRFRQRSYSFSYTSLAIFFVPLETM